MADTTLNDELKLLINNYFHSRVREQSDIVRTIDNLVLIGQLQTLQRLAEDVDNDVYDECERWIERLRGRE